MEYWIRLDGEQIGPLTLEEVRRLPLKPDTPVWVEGMEDWTTASNILQLADMWQTTQTPFGTPPPTPGVGVAPGHPFSSNGSAPVSPRRQIDLTGCPDNHLGMAIGAVIVLTACCGVIGLLGLVPLLNAMRVRLLFLTGEYDRAYGCAQKAKNWSIACYVIAALYVIFAAIVLSVIGVEAVIGAKGGDPSFLGI